MTHTSIEFQNQITQQLINLTFSAAAIVNETYSVSKSPSTGPAQDMSSQLNGIANRALTTLKRASLTGTQPRFNKDQHVYFMGGSGTIRSYQLDAGKWTYVVEMELGPEPVMGRIGSETTLLLHEEDIQEEITDVYL